ncbi:MAG TPA: hypothetical protein VJ831_07960 [Jatrophihabitantaceae bacterium]|nr:hypothetical protein [Jatrophihabitantaceae bacterium]
MRRTAALLLAGVAMLTTVVARPQVSVAATRDAMAPLVVVHGYSDLSCPGFDVQTAMAGPALFAWNHGEYMRPFVPISYYTCDFNGVDITGGHRATANTDLRVVAKQLAWWVHDNYTVRGHTVELIGHSMGGLIIRYALFKVATHTTGWPSTLLVQDAIGVSTPNAGMVMGCPTMQCTQLSIGSALVKELAVPAAQNPQGTGGTDWTMIGGSSCDVVTAASAMAMSGAHRIDYYSVQPCYHHDDYLWDSDDKLNAVLKYAQPGALGYLATRLGPHSLAMIVRATDSSAW